MTLQSSSESPPPAFHFALTRFRRFLLVPSQIFFALTGALGLAHYARQIVKVVPKNPGNGPEGVNIVEWISTNVPSLRGSFTPSWWLPNGHLQTFYSVLGNFTKVDKVQYKRTLLRVPDGGTISLDFTPLNHAELPANTPTVVVCHGLTGGSHESYVRNVLSWVIKPQSEGGLGARGVVVNFRGCAGTPLTSPQLYSAGTTMDLHTATHYLRHLYPESSLHGIGFSLGASVLSRYLGEIGKHSILSSGISVGCPWDLPAMSKTLEEGWFNSRVYSKALAMNLCRLFFKIHEEFPGVLEAENSPVKGNLDALEKIKQNPSTARLKDVDTLGVSQVGGPKGPGLWPFRDADDYYEWASAKRQIGGVKVPLLSINAFDDPIVDGTSLPIAEFQSSSHVYCAITGSGGHLGWFDGPLFATTKSKTRWILKPVSEFLQAATSDLNIRGYVEVEERDGFVMEKARKQVGKGLVAGVEEVGWKVVSHGGAIAGEKGSGTMQGL